MPTTSLPGAMPQAAAASSYTVLYRFNGGSHGDHPGAGLISVNGTLYGTGGGGKAGGGFLGKGIVYSVTMRGVMKVLHDFKGGSDGARPQAGLIDVNGTLYGTTYDGGRSSHGTVYSISTTGAEKVLHAFAGNSDGAHPAAALVDMNGTLYGTTTFGGGGTCLASGHPFGCGTIFSITTSGVEKVVYAFTSESGGEYPQAGLIAVNGSLYGTTYGGGSGSEGTVFRIGTAGVKKVLHNFGAGSDGRNPQAALIDVKGTLYGTTLYGGDVSEYKGTVFSIRTTGAKYELLHDFSGTPDGSNPQASLIYVEGSLYGTTENGGANSNDGGTVYSISTTGAENVVHSFTAGQDGNYPIAGLIDVNGRLYGTTFKGGVGSGSYGFGTVYALNP
jgi:uncharacterized repeat protein (TIGR03803 family)